MLSFMILFLLQTETALMYDAVQLFTMGLQSLDNSSNLNVTHLECNGQNSWEHGSSFINFMKSVITTTVIVTISYFI